MKLVDLTVRFTNYNLKQTKTMIKKLLILLALIPTLAIAQKVKVDGDTVYKDEAPYCLILKQGTGLAPVYSIRTLTNVEIATVIQDDAVPANEQKTAYVRITFTASGAISHFGNTIPLVKRLAKALVESDVVGTNGSNPEGEKRFVSLYPNKIVNQATVIVNINTNGPDYTPVTRSKVNSIRALNGKLSQGGTDIGTYATSNTMSGGKSVSTTTYSLPNGVQCAVATYDNIGAKTASVRTLRDNATHTVTIKNSAMSEQEIADWLSTNGYL